MILSLKELKKYTKRDNNNKLRHKDMSEKSTHIDANGYFVYKKRYPDVSTILSGQQIIIEEFCKTAVFVFDTNSLLVPYLVGKKGLKEITRIYKKVLDPKRTFVTAHSLREFAKNRSSKISELYTEVDKALSEIPSIKDFNYPILADMDAYKNLVKCKEDIQKHLKDYKNALQNIQKGINGWNWFDPVTCLYSEIFKKDNIFESNQTDEELAKEFQERMQHDIPPGNKDKSKDENAIGDFLIWKCILEIAKLHNQDVVFVTNDEKNDWMLKGNKKSISPRFELVDEFYRITKKRFTCLNFADFLEIQGATKEVVTEVETLAEEIEQGRPTNIIKLLNEISKVLRHFINHAAHGKITKEDLYIEDKYIYSLVKEFESSWEMQVIKHPLLYDFRSEIYQIADWLSKITSLNAEINYQVIRMKKNTYDKQTELIVTARNCYEMIVEVLQLFNSYTS